MDQKDVIAIATQYGEVVTAKYGAVRLILFGSYARGNYTKDSDIDIAVVLKDYSNRQETQLELMRLRRKIDNRIEPHPFRETDFDITNPMVNEILKTGRDIKLNLAS